MMRRLHAVIPPALVVVGLSLVLSWCSPPGVAAAQGDGTTPTTPTAPPMMPIVVTVDLSSLEAVIRSQHVLDRMSLDDIETDIEAVTAAVADAETAIEAVQAETARTTNAAADADRLATDLAGRVDRLTASMQTAVGLLGVVVALTAAAWLRTMLRERTPRGDT